MNKEIEIIRDTIKQTLLDTEIVYTKNAYGRILAKDIYSNANVPSFRSSAKHGYAVRASDGKGLRIVLSTSLRVRVISIRLRLT